ncbi:MAG: DNA translocase FtsK [Actinobacteria bacterium]|nr:MAG: DNA translocase FtsK [Actinomycetota bacterium]
MRKKKRAARKAHGHQHPELLGLVLAAVGVFLSTVLYLGWSGGFAGGLAADGLDALIGAARAIFPAACMIVGALFLARSELVDMRPFRTGLVVFTAGLMLTLGKAHGGYLGAALALGFGIALGSTGVLIVGVTTLLAGSLLLSGASAGAFIRRSGRAVRATAEAARRARTPLPETMADLRLVEPTEPRPETHAPVIDAASEYPDVVEADPPGPAPLLLDDPQSEPDQTSLFDVGEAVSKDYRLPDRAILRRSPGGTGNSADQNARVAEALVQTLAHFGVQASVIGQISGPRVTRYELQLAPGTKVSKVAALKDDLSYALATTEIRILAPIPGKQAVGVELPNASPNYVALGDIFDDLPATASPLSVWLGKDISGAAVWTDLARMPHVLIAGTTGSGKSGCINTILTSILLRSTPDEVRLILIDPKKIELSYYEAIPHLLTPGYRAGAKKANRAFRSRGEPTLPHLLVVIDELADLMMIAPQDVEDAVIRLAQKSRAVGIHLVLATQRPSVDVITGMIKANVPSRIAFAVSSQTDSRVILDASGAESLLGQGDMLFKPLGTSRLQRLQGAYVSEEEIALIVEQCRAQREQELDESLLEAPEPPPEEHDDADGDFDPDEDPLLERAIEIVVTAQTASTSLLQRRLRVGYTRAGRLIDMLERRGIISGYEGSKPRRVLVDEAELSRVIAN